MAIAVIVPTTMSKQNSVRRRWGWRSKRILMPTAAPITVLETMLPTRWPQSQQQSNSLGIALPFGDGIPTIPTIPLGVHPKITPEYPIKIAEEREGTTATLVIVATVVTMTHPLPQIRIPALRPWAFYRDNPR